MSGAQPSSLVQATMALDSIQLSKLKTINNLDAVDMNMQKLVSIYKTMLGLLIFAIVAVVLNLVFLLLFVYIQYRDLINVVNAAAIYGAPGGLATAFACRFPVLAKVFGFVNSSYPIALLFCVTDPTLNSYFSQNYNEIMQTMLSLTQQGGGCGIGTQNVGEASPAMLICCALQQVNGEYPNIALCSAPCNAYGSDQPASYVSDGISGLLNGAMMGMDVGGPVGALVGALLVGGATIGLKAYANSYTDSPPCIQ